MVSDVNYENFTFPANLKKKKNGKTTDGKARKKIIKSFTWDTSVATEYTCNGLIDVHLKVGLIWSVCGKFSKHSLKMNLLNDGKILAVYILL